MLHVFYAKWHNQLPKSESSEGYNGVAEHRGSSFVPRCSKDWLEIEMLKESLRRWDEEMRQRDKEMRRWDEAMRQRDDFYASAFAQQQTILQVSSLNYFIRYRTLSYIFKTNLLHCNMYNKWRSSKEFKCCSSNLPHHYLTSGRLLELQYIFYY
jgi:hypothetical protein